jgi:hypothetical protein
LFYRFNLHIICNERTDLVVMTITPGNVNDRKPIIHKSFINKLWG